VRQWTKTAAGNAYFVPVAEGDALLREHAEAEKWRQRQSEGMRSGHPDWPLVQAVLACRDHGEKETDRE